MNHQICCVRVSLDSIELCILHAIARSKYELSNMLSLSLSLSLSCSIPILTIHHHGPPSLSVSLSLQFNFSYCIPLSWIIYVVSNTLLSPIKPGIIHTSVKE